MTFSLHISFQIFISFIINNIIGYGNILRDEFTILRSDILCKREKKHIDISNLKNVPHLTSYSNYFFSTQKL